jgi:hypothetical protein
MIRYGRSQYFNTDIDIQYKSKTYSKDKNKPQSRSLGLYDTCTGRTSEYWG